MNFKLRMSSRIKQASQLFDDLNSFWIFILFAAQSPCRSVDFYNESDEQHIKKYNVKEKRVLVESPSSWSSPSSVRRCRESFHASREKRNPLKNTKLTYFRSDAQIPPVYIKSIYNDCDGLPSVISYKDEKADTLESKSNSKFDWNQNSSIQEKSSKADFRISSRLRAISDKYLKTSTNRLLAKLYRTTDKQANDTERESEKKEKKGKRLRSFSYGTLPGLKEFQAFRDLGESKSTPDTNSDSVSNIIFDENEDCDSGILVSSNSSVVDSCASSTYRHAGAYHFRSASQDTPVSSEEKYDLHIEDSQYCAKENGNFYGKFITEHEAREPSRLELTERQRRRMRLPLITNLQNDDGIQTHSTQISDVGSKHLKVVRLRRMVSDDDVGILIEKFVSGENDIFVIVHILPGGVAHR